MSTNLFRVCSPAVRPALGLVVVALGLVPAAPAAQAAPGDLDRTFAGFGSGGTVILRRPTGWHTEAMAMQPDGKIVTVGRAGEDLLAMRYHPNGRLDATFGDGGEVTIPNGQYSLIGEGVAIQEDGRIVVAGTISPEADFFVARLAATGQLDESFGRQGLVFTDFDDDEDGAHAVAIQPDGKIVAAGHARISGDDDFAVARYNPDGSLDTTFAGDGKASVGFGENDRANDVALQPDGKIVVVGNSMDDAHVARYLQNGQLDDSFDGDGKRTIGANDANVHGVAVQTDGKIVLLGDRDDTRSNELYDPEMAVWRLNPDSTLDTTFNGNGFLEVAGGLAVGRAVALLADGRILGAGGYFFGEQRRVRLWPDGTYDAGGQQALAWDEPGFPPGSVEIAHGMAVQPDGKVIVAGEVQNAERTESDAALARFLPDGRPDTTFGRFGRLSFGFGAYNGARAVAVQPDGKIVAAGFFRSGRTVNFMVARFLADGSVDNTCAVVGQNLLDFMGGDDWAWALALAPDGKILVAGEAFNGARTVFGVARFLPTCAVDTSFDVDGKQLVEYAVGPTHWATSVVVQPDRKVVVAGQVGNDFALTRLNENGSLDRTFGSSGWTIPRWAGYRASTPSRGTR